MDQLNTGSSQAIAFKWVIYLCFYWVPLWKWLVSFVAKKTNARK